jgi:hypothetical protein
MNLWKMLNGFKLNTGLVVAVAGLILQNQGMSHDEAVKTVSLSWRALEG